MLPIVPACPSVQAFSTAGVLLWQHGSAASARVMRLAFAGLAGLPDQQNAVISQSFMPRPSVQASVRTGAVVAPHLCCVNPCHASCTGRACWPPWLHGPAERSDLPKFLVAHPFRRVAQQLSCRGSTAPLRQLCVMRPAVQGLLASLAAVDLQNAVGTASTGQLFLLKSVLNLERSPICGNLVCETGERPVNGNSTGGKGLPSAGLLSALLLFLLRWC